MKFEDAKLKEILLKGGFATEEDIKLAEVFAKEHYASMIDYFLTKDLLSKNLLGQAIAEYFSVLHADLIKNQPAIDQILRIPQDIARAFRVVLFAIDKDNAIVATDNPQQEGLVEAIRAVLPLRNIVVAFSLPEEIDSILSLYRKPLDTRFSKIIAEKRRVAPEIVDEIISDALSYHASDIHFEPQGKEIVVRFRVDGALQEAGRLPREHYDNILSLIKVKSNLRIDEHLVAQDGSMRYEKDGTAINIRASLVPTIEGEKIVLRILSAYMRELSLNELGMSKKDQETLTTALGKHSGMILVAGPTSSGKTTTAYSILKLLNGSDVNITTIEDPIESRIIGTNQIQVNLQNNLTFAKGLKSIVDQDPDIIFVGEISDAETAGITINAAITGHLLLSTFHAHSAAITIPRFLSLGIEPFLLASTLEVVVAQCLVRKICEHCRYSTVVSRADFHENMKPILDTYFPEEKITIYRGKGCDACGFTGHKGRIAIFELIRMTPEMQALILKSPSAQQIWELAKQQGSISMFEDGIGKVKTGVISLDELVHVAEPTAHEK